jgi:hypothetical protein
MSVLLFHSLFEVDPEAAREITEQIHGVVIDLQSSE